MPSKIHPVWYAVAIPLAGVFVAVLLVIWRKGSPEQTGRFSVQQYCAAPANFMGNRYTLDGQIDAQLLWEKNVGRLLAVRLPEGRRLPVFVDDSFRENLSVGQRYRMDVSIGEGGIVRLESISKL